MSTSIATFPIAERAIQTSSGATATVAGDTISLRGADGALVATYDAATGALTLESSGEIQISAAKRVRIDTDVLSVNARVAEWAVGHWELNTERIVERTKDTFRTAERMLESRAGRARFIVDKLLELSGRRTAISSEEDTHIDGKRVLLG